MNIHWKDWCWSSIPLATWCKEPDHWKRLWCLERLKAGEGGDRGWDGWMASSTQWKWIWKLQEIVNGMEAWHAAVYGVSKIWHDWETEQQLVILSIFSYTYWPSVCLPWRNVYIGLLFIWWWWWFVFVLFFFFTFSFTSCLHILEINPFLVALFASIFSQSISCHFILFMVSFTMQ